MTKKQKSNFDKAAEEVSFQLTYGVSRKKRRFHDDGLTGPMISDAFNPGEKSSGDWEGMAWYDKPNLTVDKWKEEFFTVAISESIHEALEHYQEDGRPYLNPHGQYEREIVQASEKFARSLLKKYAQR